jgi:hypothetical protein
VKSDLPRHYRQVLEMLTKPTGATITELAEAHGWQPHTTRAILSTARSGYGWLLDKRADEKRGTVYTFAGLGPVTKPLPPRKAAKAESKIEPAAKPAGKRKAAVKAKASAKSRKAALKSVQADTAT